MSRASFIGILAVVIVVGVVGGLVYLAETTEPQTQQVEQTLPDGRFPK